MSATADHVFLIYHCYSRLLVYLWAYKSLCVCACELVCVCVFTVCVSISGVLSGLQFNFWAEVKKLCT